jgi:cell division ATPase FtsA
VCRQLAYNMEIPINHKKIIKIEPLKTFSHSIRKARRLIKEGEKEKAKEILEYCKKTFKLDKQIEEINSLKNM